MGKIFFEIKNKTANSVDVYIYGTIGTNNSYWDEGTNNRAFALVSELTRLDKEGITINVHINSPGGSIADGLAIYNAMRSLKATVTTHNDGLCASMATILFLAGSKRIMPKTALLHFHRASTYAWGNVPDFEQAIKTLEAFENAIIEAIIERTGMTNEEIRAKWMDGGEHYESATDMAAIGIVTEISSAEAKIPVKNFSSFKNVLEAYEKNQNQTKSSSFISAISNFFNPEKRQEMSQKKVTLMAMALALQAFALPANEDGSVVVTAEQFTEIEKIFQALEDAQKKLADAEARATAAEAKAEAAQKLADDAAAKLKGTAGAFAQTGIKSEKTHGEDTDLNLDPVNSEKI